MVRGFLLTAKFGLPNKQPCSSPFPCFDIIENVLPPKGEKDTKPVWGEGKADAKEALESNGFMMRNVVFHPASGGGRRRRNRNRRNNISKKEG